MSILVTAAALAGISGFAYLWTRDALFPPVLMSALWALTMALAWPVAVENQYVFDPLTLWIFVIGAFCFFVGSLLTSGVAARRYCRPAALPVATGVPSSGRIATVLLISALFVPFMAARALYLAQNGPTDVWSINLRYGVALGEGIGWPAYGTTFAIVGLLATQVRRLHVRDATTRRLLIASITIILVYSLMVTARTFLLQVALVSVGPGLFMRRIRLGRNLPIVAFVGFIVFSFYTIILREGNGDGSQEGAIVSYSIDNFMTYMIGGPFAFDSIVKNGLEMTYGSNTFRFIYAVLNRLGFNIEVVELIKQYSTYPIVTNVYTFYYPYFVDFGMFGVCASTLCIGMLNGRIYRGTMKRLVSSSTLLASSLVMYPMLMQAFDDQYVSILSMWIQYGILWFVLVRPVRVVFGSSASSGARLLRSLGSVKQKSTGLTR